MEELINWLDKTKGKVMSEEDFAEGFAFYKKHGKAKRLLRLFSTGNNHIKSRKLYNELLLVAQKLEREEATAKEEGDEGEDHEDEPEDFSRLDTIGLPEDLKELHFKKGRLFNQASKARRQLYEMHFGEEKLNPVKSFELVKIAVDNMLENKQIWKEIKHFKAEGEMLNEHPALAENKLIEELKALQPLELQKRLQNLPTYISKAKRFIRENPKSDKLLEKEGKIKAFEREIALIEQILTT